MARHAPFLLVPPLAGEGDRPDAELFRPETDPDVLAGFLSDAARYPGWAEGLVRPRSEGELARLLVEAGRRGLPVTPAAQHTSLTGASVPEGGWVMDLSALGPGIEAVRVDREGRVATAPARVLLGEFQGRVEEEGRFYPPDPTSRHEATLGATVACNASGARSFRYGPTREWVARVRVVLPGGEVADVRRGQCTAEPGEEFVLVRPSGGELRVPVPGPVPEGVKSSLGYGVRRGDAPDLVDLFVGSEGTLGVLTEVEVALLPLPELTLAGLAFFPAEDAGLTFVEGAREGGGGVAMRCLEWFDRGSLERARGRFERFRIPGEAAAAVYFEQECDAATAGDVAEAWWGLLAACGACGGDDGVQVADDDRGREAFRAFRHAVPAAVNEEGARLGRRKLGTDLAWPRPLLRPMMRAYHRVLDDLPGSLPEADLAALRLRHGAVPRSVPWLLFGHVGDCHLHANLLPRDDAEAEAAAMACRELARRAVASGGSVAGEHGIGKSKRSLLGEMVGEEGIRRMARIKLALDPAGILGRGNIIPPEFLGLGALPSSRA